MSSTKEKEKDKRTVEDQVERSKPTPTSQTPPSGTTTPASKSSTGGSSATSYGPNSGSSKGLDVFGPTFTGIGDGKNLPTTDSSKLNKYPTLLGGGEPRQTTRVEGVGVVTPSKSYQLAMDGSLPSSTSMGSNEENKFFPFSRQPGDMEKIPDPYRVSQQFSASNYSTKTEPVPYLTNFSAFQK